MVDRFTKRTFLMTLPKNATPQHIANSIYYHVVSGNAMGFPHELISDRDPLFAGSYFRSFVDRVGIELSMSSARSQQTNGLAERTIATVEEILRTRIDLRQLTWPSLLSELSLLFEQPAIK